MHLSPKLSMATPRIEKKTAETTIKTIAKSPNNIKSPLFRYLKNIMQHTVVTTKIAITTIIPAIKTPRKIEIKN